MLLDFCDSERRKEIMEKEGNGDEEESENEENEDEKEEENEEDLDLSEGDEDQSLVDEMVSDKDEVEEGLEDEEVEDSDDSEGLEDEEGSEAEEEDKNEEAEDIYGRKINKLVRGIEREFKFFFPDPPESSSSLIQRPRVGNSKSLTLQPMAQSNVLELIDLLTVLSISCRMRCWSSHSRRLQSCGRRVRKMVNFIFFLLS